MRAASRVDKMMRRMLEFERAWGIRQVWDVRMRGKLKLELRTWA